MTLPCPATAAPLRSGPPADERGPATASSPPSYQAGQKVADYYQQRGVSGPELQQETGRVLGTFAAAESIAFGFRQGLRFLSMMTLTLGLLTALLLWQASRDLRAPPRAGYS